MKSRFEYGLCVWFASPFDDCDGHRHCNETKRFCCGGSWKRYRTDVRYVSLVDSSTTTEPKKGMSYVWYDREGAARRWQQDTSGREDTRTARETASHATRAGHRDVIFSIQHTKLLKKIRGTTKPWFLLPYFERSHFFRCTPPSLTTISRYYITYSIFKWIKVWFDVEQEKWSS